MFCVDPFSAMLVGLLAVIYLIWLSRNKNKKEEA